MDDLRKLIRSPSASTSSAKLVRVPKRRSYRASPGAERLRPGSRNAEGANLFLRRLLRRHEVPIQRRRRRPERRGLAVDAPY